MLVLWERDGVPVKESASGCSWIRHADAAAQAAGGGRARQAHPQRPDERQVLIALTPQGQTLREKARTVPQAILAASACSLGELSAMKNELIALRDRLNAAAGE